MNAHVERESADLSAHARHELGLEEVREMSRTTPKFFGTADGMYIAGNDDMIALRLYNGHGYECVTRELWRRCCKGATLAVDVGTHSGIFTLDAYRAGAEVVMSIEPHPINYARLVINLRVNGFSSQGAYYGAVGDKDKIGMFHAGTMHAVHAAGCMDRKSANGEQFPARVMRLDSLINPASWSGLRVLKIDAENYTPNVIDGMGGIFEAGHRPDMIIECLEGGMGEKLRSLGYQFWRIWETGLVDPVEDLLPHNPNKNYNGTHEDCRNRFASVKGLPNG